MFSTKWPIAPNIGLAEAIIGDHRWSCKPLLFRRNDLNYVTVRIKILSFILPLNASNQSIQNSDTVHHTRCSRIEFFPYDIFITSQINWGKLVVGHNANVELDNSVVECDNKTRLIAKLN